MRRGELGPMMYLVLALIALVAIIIVVMAVGRSSFGVLDWIKGGLP